MGLMQMLAAQEGRPKFLINKTESTHTHQLNQQHQIGVRNQATSQAQQDLAQMREDSRNRSEIPPMHWAQPPVVNHARGERAPPNNDRGYNAKERISGPRETTETPSDRTSRGARGEIPLSRCSTCRPTPVMDSRHYPLMGPQTWLWIRAPLSRRNTIQNWKREAKLRVAGQPGATVAQLMAKLIHVHPLAVKTEAIAYKELADQAPDSRAIVKIVDMVDSRFGATDSERARAWMTAFADFKRETQEITRISGLDSLDVLRS